MSRIGKNPISVPEGVEININGSVVNVKGPKGRIERNIFILNLKVQMEEGSIVINRSNE